MVFNRMMADNKINTTISCQNVHGKLVKQVLTNSVLKMSLLRQNHEIIADLCHKFREVASYLCYLKHFVQDENLVYCFFFDDKLFWYT